ncbi:LPS assembly lipoprotein LptE [Nitratiruptor sp. YY09-18]|uniref:LPS assembly lipoprotein LptE n=1 Tax=Nitratiruptor sp. YY09-18 TaxID=2724901 RepID=UPI00191649F6|nr:LPS assembly lipoprotein LptE [Nitratiruptor sp. YY09-18]BCD68563.1 hypothetical protein NitYY0918_C1480 [Nitratiruptor sp. YY09-18]
MRFLVVALLVFALTGCGYKPSSRYLQENIKEKIYIHVNVLLNDPEDALIIKDAVNRALLYRFGNHLVSYDQAQTKINVRVRSLSFAPLERNTYGYVDQYRAKIVLDFDVRDQKGKRRITTDGYYDFAIEPNSIITDTMRFDAIRRASQKAIDKFIAQMAKSR